MEEQCNHYCRLFALALSLPLRAWLETLAPWKSFVDEGARLWGEKPVFWQLAILAAGIRSTTEPGEGHGLLDEQASICGRARFARLQSGSPNWWLKQLDMHGDLPQAIFVLLNIFTWATFRTIFKLKDVLAERLRSLSTARWVQLNELLGQLNWLVGRNNRHKLNFDDFDDVSIRMCSVLSTRLDNRQIDTLYVRFLREYTGDDPVVLQFCADAAVQRLLSKQPDWRPDLDIVRHAYLRGFAGQTLKIRRSAQISIDVAETVCNQPEAFPLDLVAVADEMLTNRAKSGVEKVATIAGQQKWFA